MKIKEFNKIRNEIYAEGLKHPEIAEALYYGGVCYLYDVLDASRNHAVLVLTAKTQLNENTLRNAGLDPETAMAKLVMTYHQQTKCVTFPGFPR